MEVESSVVRQAETSLFTVQHSLRYDAAFGVEMFPVHFFLPDTDSQS